MCCGIKDKHDSKVTNRILPMLHFGIQYEDNTILNLVSYLYFYTN